MRVWVAKPYSGSENAPAGDDAASRCSAAEQHAACAEIIAYHIKEHLPAGAKASVRVYEAHDKSCNALAEVVRKVVTSNCRWAASLDQHNPIRPICRHVSF